MRTPVVTLNVGLAAAMLVACSAGGPGSTTPMPSQPAPSSSTPAPATTPTDLSSPRPSTGDSGVAGRTMVDGGCPVEIEGSPCPHRPISARVTVIIAATGASVAETTSDADGYFRIALAPGRYRLHAVNLTGAAYPRGSTVDIVVDLGRDTPVVIVFDSGIQ